MWILLMVLGFFPLLAGIGHWTSGDSTNGLIGVILGAGMILPQLVMFLGPIVIGWFN